MIWGHTKRVTLLEILTLASTDKVLLSQNSPNTSPCSEGLLGIKLTHKISGHVFINVTGFIFEGTSGRNLLNTPGPGKEVDPKFR